MVFTSVDCRPWRKESNLMLPSISCVVPHVSTPTLKARPWLHVPSPLSIHHAALPYLPKLELHTSSFMVAHITSWASCYFSCLLHSCNCSLRWSWRCNAMHGTPCLAFMMAAMPISSCVQGLQRDSPEVSAASWVATDWNPIVTHKICLENTICLGFERSDSSPATK